MKKLLYTILTVFTFSSVFAGNPDRQGESGAAQLLLNPWARSAGLHTMTTANVIGVEAMQLNIAGLSRVNKTQVMIGNTQYLKGTGIGLNAIGLSQKLGENSAIGIQLMAVDFGKIPITTTNQPEGIGATYSPSFFNIGLGYSYTFQNKISVGFLVRGVSETLADISAFGIAMDAGVQYVTGKKDEFKLGISLRNIGSPMKFGGEGLSIAQNAPEGNYQLTFNVRPANYELPSMLNLGVSYDFDLGENLILTGIGNFTSNSFAQDQVGLGFNFAIGKFFQVRAGYKYEFGQFDESGLYSSMDKGLSAGVSVEIPLKKNSESKLGLDYGYRHTTRWSGSHSIGVSINL